MLAEQFCHITCTNTNSVLYCFGSKFLSLLFHTLFPSIVVSKGKGAHPCTSSSGQGGGKRVLEDFFKNPTTQLRVVWGLTEKKCEQTPKFACFSV